MMMADEGEAWRMIWRAFWSRRRAGGCKACSAAERLGGSWGPVHPQGSAGARGSGQELLLGLRRDALLNRERFIESTRMPFHPYAKEKWIKTVPKPGSSLIFRESPRSQPGCWHSRIKLSLLRCWGDLQSNKQLAPCPFPGKRRTC